MVAAAPLAITLVHGVLAGGVTVHVLLGKRTAASAVAWIGLAWLTPLLGSCLYALLGINRVRRRASSLRRRYAPGTPLSPSWAVECSDQLRPLNIAAGKLTQRALVGGNAVAALRGGDEAYPQMIGAIAEARYSIALSSYIFRADAAGTPFLDALASAVRRGVEVRVLIDGFGGDYFRSAAYRRLRLAGVPASRFLHSPLPWRMPLLNLRNHKKVLVVDGCRAFTGGLNLGAENVAALTPLSHIRDTHFRIEGPVVRQIVEAFADDWQFTTGERLAGEAWYPPAIAAGAIPARVVSSGPDQDIGKIEFVTLVALGCARSAVRIMTPYFLPDEQVLTALALAAMRGVTVDLILPEHSNHPSVDWASRTRLGALIEVGCRVWYHGAPFDHSKLMTVDGIWCLIGSTNWDARSFRLNFELDLEAYDPVLAASLDSLMASQQQRRLGTEELSARSIPVRLRDSAAHLLQPYL